MSAEQDAMFESMRKAVSDALNNLHEAVADACPGRHGPVQHRDRESPWCPYCGRTADGRLVGGGPATTTASVPG